MLSFLIFYIYFFKLDGFLNWKIDLGGEMIHGKGNLLEEIAVAQGWQKRQIFFSFPPVLDDECDENVNGTSTEWFWIGRESKLLSYKTTDKDVRKLINVLRTLFEGPQLEKNISLHQYLVDNGVSQRVLGIADALWGKVAGSQIDLIGANEIQKEEVNTSITQGFEFNYRIKNSFYELVQYLKQDLNIKTNWQAKSITSTSMGHQLVENQKGEILRTKKVVVSVPLTILKDGDIRFDPKLPEEKIEALNRMDMAPATKVILTFSTRFWPENIQLVICGDSPIPELWIDGGNYRGPNAPWVVVGFVIGDCAQNFSNLKEGEIVRIFQNQLNQMFGTITEPTPSFKYMTSSLVFKWADQPFIRGGYSYPKLGSLGDSQILAKPVRNQIFFCGEASSYTSESGTINSAILTGKRASEEVIYSLGENKL